MSTSNPDKADQADKADKAALVCKGAGCQLQPGDDDGGNWRSELVTGLSVHYF